MANHQNYYHNNNNNNNYHHRNNNYNNNYDQQQEDYLKSIITSVRSPKNFGQKNAALADDSFFVQDLNPDYIANNNNYSNGGSGNNNRYQRNNRQYNSPNNVNGFGRRSLNNGGFAGNSGNNQNFTNKPRAYADNHHFAAVHGASNNNNNHQAGHMYNGKRSKQNDFLSPCNFNDFLSSNSCISLLALVSNL